MNRKDAMAWVLSVCTATLRRSQAKTLGALVAGAMAVERVSLASIGRAMLGEAAVKHQIKRVYRFIANQRVEPVIAMTAVVKRLLRGWPANKPLLISFDWTDIRDLQTLMAAAVVGGRAIPLCWASCRKNTWKGHRSRNAFEEALLLSLKAMLPSHVRPIILGDRGFGRTSLGEFCQRHGLRYVIRIQGKVIVEHQGKRLRLDQMFIKRGCCKKLIDVLYRSYRPIRQHVVMLWAKGLSDDRDECWYLMTDLPGRSKAISDLYARRMSVEELFRDGKNRRNGWSLRDTGIRREDRLDRLILVLAITYLLLVGLALVALQRCRPSMWCSNTRKHECRVFQIGRIMLTRLNLTAAAALTALIAALQTQVPKWG